jgi:SAM-dependent methyltransferase
MLLAKRTRLARVSLRRKIRRGTELNKAPSRSRRLDLAPAALALLLAFVIFGKGSTSARPALAFSRSATQQNSQAAPSTTAPSTTRKTSKPFTGDLSTFEYEGRDEKLQVQRVMDLLRIHAGSAVADIGAGSGWFTVRASKRVEATGIVYAVDINPESIKYIEERAHREDLRNVRTILGKEDDALLPPASVDSVLLLKTYHEVAQPVRLLENLRRALRPGALVGVIDRNGHGDDHGVGRDVVVKEAGEAGYELTGEYDFVKADREDYFLIFRAR